MAEENISLADFIQDFTDDMYCWILDPASSPQTKRFLFPKMIQEQRMTYAVNIGSANAIRIVLNSPLTSYVEGVLVYFKATAANTGATTLKVDALGLIDIVDREGNALTAGTIPVGSLNIVQYDGVNFQLLVSDGGGDWVSNFVSPDADSIQNTVTSNISAQTGITTFDSYFSNITLGARSSTGEANHIHLQTNSIDVFKVDVDGTTTVSALLVGDANKGLAESGTELVLRAVGSAQVIVTSSGLRTNHARGAQLRLNGFTWRTDLTTQIISNIAGTITVATLGIDALEIDASQNSTFYGSLTTTAGASLTPIIIGGHTADPTGGVEGGMYFNSTLKVFKGHNGTSWSSFGGGIQPDIVNILTDGSDTEIKIISDASQANWIFNNESDTNNVFSRVNYINRSTFNGTASANLGGTISYQSQEGTSTMTDIASTSYYRLEATGVSGLWRTIANGSGSISRSSRIQVAGAYGSNPASMLLETASIQSNLYTSGGSAALSEIESYNLRPQSGVVTVAFGGYKTFSLTESGGGETDVFRETLRWNTLDTIASLAWSNSGGTPILEILENDKIGVFGATPVVQQAHIADATDAATAISQLNLLLTQFAAFGFQASS